MVDIDQEVDQASEEEEDGDMEKGREGLDSNWETESLDTFGKEGSYPSTLIRGVTTLGGLEISAHPLLHERGQESTCQAQHEADEPQNVHANGRDCRPKSLAW
jgi:hypothetical protein